MSSPHHVFTAVSGFGLRVIPRAPFRACLGPSPEQLDVAHGSPEGERFVRLSADGSGGYTSELRDQASSLVEVLDVTEGPQLERWHLDVGSFLVALPEGFELCSVPGDSTSPFDLVGPHETCLYVQRPRVFPPIAKRVAPGQRVVDQGSDWIEVTYGHEGQEWWQRHQDARSKGALRLWFTVQALAEHQDEGRQALEGLIASLVSVRKRGPYEHLASRRSRLGRPKRGS